MQKAFGLSCDIKNYFQATITWQCAQGNFMIISSQSAIQIMEELSRTAQSLSASLAVKKW